MMVADNPDKGGNFSLDSDALATLVPHTYITESIYLENLDLTIARNTLLNGLNNGAFLVNYIGHAGLDRLAAEGLLIQTDVPELANGNRMPVIVGMTCSAARFEIPGFDTIGESLVTQPNGGAIAVWAPTGWSLNPPAKQLNSAFFKAVFQDGELILGDAILSALKTYAKQGNTRFMLDIYTLIGDPALRLK